MRRRAFLSGLAFSALPQAAEVLDFQSDGVLVPIVVRRARRPRGPAVVLLHGRAGMSLYGDDFAKRSERLARAGFSSFTPQYFAATASPDSPTVTPGRFSAWARAIADAVSYAKRQPFVNPRRVALLGVSLGGFIATVAAASGVDVAAIVAESAGLSDYFPAAPRRLPPLLIVHAIGDPIVPSSNAVALQRRALGLGGAARLVELAGSEHLLDGASAKQALQLEIGFFSQIMS